MNLCNLSPILITLFCKTTTKYEVTKQVRLLVMCTTNFSHFTTNYAHIKGVGAKKMLCCVYYTEYTVLQTT